MTEKKKSFYNNALLFNVIFCIVLLLGFLVAKDTVRQIFPEVNFDTIIVRTYLEGASPFDVEVKITDLIEEAIEDIPDIEEIVSSSSLGCSIVTVTIDHDVSSKRRRIARDDIRNHIEAIQDFPEQLRKKPHILEKTSSQYPCMNVFVCSQDYEQSCHISDELRDQLSDIDNVGSVGRIGYREKALWVEIDAERLPNYDCTIEDVIHAIQTHDVQRSVGQIETKDAYLGIRVDYGLDHPENLLNIPVRSSLGGSVLLKDIASVRWGYDDEKIRTLIDGRQGVLLEILRLSQADTVCISHSVKKTLETYRERYPETDFVVLTDSSFRIQKILKIIYTNIFLGLIIVLVLLFLFLNVRIAFFVSLGIPFSLLGTFILFPVLGLTINIITLMGMTIILGMLVDDAIVVGESIFQKYQEGYVGIEAISKGVQAVWGPVCMTVLSTMVCFVPLFYLSGIMGRFVFSLPCVIIVALAWSLFESLTILPMHLVTNRHREPIGEPFFTFLKKIYRRLLQLFFRFRFLSVVLIAGLLFFCAYQGMKRYSFVLFPLQDANYIKIELYGSAKDTYDEMVSKIEPIFETIRDLNASSPDFVPEEDHHLKVVDNCVAYVGIEKLEEITSLAVTPCKAVVVLYLPNYVLRHWHCRLLVDFLRKKTWDGFESIVVEQERRGPPVGADIMVHINSPSKKINGQYAEKIVRYLKNRTGVFNVQTNQRPGLKSYVVQPDPVQMAYYRVSPERLAQVLSCAYRGFWFSTYCDSYGDRFRLRLRLLKRDCSEMISKLCVRNQDYRAIPIEQFSSIREENQVESYFHQDGENSLTVRASVDEKLANALVENQAIRDFVHSLNPPLSMDLSFGGQEKESQKSFGDFQKAFIFAFFLIYLMLLVFYRSFWIPFIIVSVIPFGLVAVIIVFACHSLPMSFFAVLGMLGLIGVMVNDSMVMVSSLVQLSHTDYMSIIDTSVLRLRPVLLTTITTVMGLMPTAYGWGGEDMTLKPITLAMSWGLCVATPVTLFLVPLMYSLGFSFMKRVRKIFKWKNHDEG